LKRFLCAYSLSLISTVGFAENQFSTTAPQFNVPEIGSGIGFIDQYNERYIGEKVYREVHRQLPVMQNTWLEDQLLKAFSNILSQTQLGQPIGLVVIDDPQINAFAVPGGLFALNAGLITNANNMDEVAGVMAHEIAHVTQRHYSRSQEAFKGQGLLALAGILVGALVASKADGDVGSAVMVGTQAAMMDKQLSYSRNQEREADRIGMQYMYGAGYNPQSMADFFEVMHRATSRVSFLPDFWLTHPLTTERMSEARLRANQLPKVKSSWRDEDFEILKLYTLVASNQATEQQLQTLVNQNSYAAELALASFYVKQGDYKLAQQVLDQAKSHQRLHNLQTLIQTDILLGQNRVNEALAVIQSPASIMPENRALNYKLAEVYIQQKRPELAQPVLNRFLNTNPRDVSAWRLMQQAASLDKQSPMHTVNVLRYRAEVQFWSGFEEEGIKSLLHAQRLAKDNESMSATIKMRLTQMQKDRQFRA
jgi:predicted Zn-dependent protease